MCTEIMKQVKLFETDGMPNEVFKTLLPAYIGNDDINSYCVGFQVKEAKNFMIEEPQHKEEYAEQMAKFMVVDDYLKGHGAEHMEQVLIYHGTFNMKLKHLF